MMRKSILWLFSFMLIFAVCSCKSESDKVKDFAGDFAEAITQGDRAAVNEMYPDAAQCDSLALIHYSADSIYVQQTPKEGVYKVYYSPHVFVTVKRGKDGDLHVVNSNGIFAIGKDLKRLAISTGWIQFDMDDLQCQKQLADKTFLDYLYSKAVQRINSDVIVSEWNYKLPDGWDLFQEGRPLVTISLTVQNTSSMPLKGSDYNVTSRVLDDQNNWRTRELNGVDVPAGGTAQITFTQTAVTGPFEGPYQVIAQCESTIHFTLSKADLVAHFLQPTGQEYEEYKSHKS